ncbi:high-potential iron-sulfur protein [Alkalilimnicola ehrlichii MLHE-1]|uniref:High potential iron-sulfur protein n=1 Tax=Alkalilimnicola ehrlichii (strain ATCC BAA-1101 / DSM 17681 / MLHE-1) TaxID=187272 RepID=Q0A8A2_ALKEH|nr:high-potential iron-sulfur protein [Alkalilimnicola ehrlichii]ABI56935.1 High potential iron-sulfur protein [Alkalilimnicola ehrlichii MLHE-1]
MSHDIDTKRRNFLKTTALGVAAVPFAGVMLQQQVAKADLPQLSEDDDIAQSLDYVHDAADAADHSAYQEGSTCGNCSLWTGGDAQWGGCQIIPGHHVNRDGWCNAWVPAA